MTIHKAVTDYQLIEKTTYAAGAPKSKGRKILWFVLFLLKNFSKLHFNPLRLRKLQRDAHQLSLVLSLESFLKEWNFDIVHAHFGQRGAAVADLLKNSHLPKFKFVTSFHGYDLIPSLTEQYKRDYQNLFNFSDVVTVNSKYLETLLLAVFPNPRNLVLLPEGLRTNQYKRTVRTLDENKSFFRIVYCGRFVGFKAPENAVQIVNLLVNEMSYKDVQLYMIGSGPLKKDVEALIDKFNLQKNVFLLGSIGQEQVIAEMNNADIFILPGIHEEDTGRAEAQGLVIQEAQAMELPVLVSSAGGMKYGLIDGVSGFVINEGSTRAFAEKIELFIRDRGLIKKMGRAGRDFVAANFDTKILGEKLMQVYTAIAQSN